MKGLRVGVWGVQVLLAVFFLGVGLMKVLRPYDAIAASQAWARLFEPGTVKLIGVIELLAVAGLILPSVTRILPVLTPVAVSGLVLTMIVAGATHIRIGEPPIATIILGGLAAFVAWGRFKKAPIAPRTRSSIA
jgi:putative oxidoreductase